MTVAPTAAPLTAAEALERQGWSPDRLIREARRIARDYERRNISYLSEHRREDLVDFVVEKALVAALRFDPERTSGLYASSGGRHFDSWICDLMWHRCTDWMRSKREGNADARYFEHNRVTLVSEFDDTEAEIDTEIERFLSDDRVAEWTSAAEIVGVSLSEYVVITLDRATAAIKRASG